ncbi:MAG: hypothetical protein R3F46_02380 [bacterium]
MPGVAGREHAASAGAGPDWLRQLPRWLARLMLAAGWMLVVANALSRQGVSALWAWDVLAASAALLISGIWPLAGGLGLIGFCLLYAVHCTNSLWQQEGYSPASFTGALITGFGNIYVLICYLAIALPGALLLLDRRLNHGKRPAR